MVVAKHVNEMLLRRRMNMERQCRGNSQYSKRKCLQITNITNSVESKYLGKRVLKLFERVKGMLDPTNVDHCHWIKTSNESKKVILKLSKRKDAVKIRSLK